MKTIFIYVIAFIGATLISVLWKYYVLIQNISFLSIIESVIVVSIGFGAGTLVTSNRRKNK